MKYVKVNFIELKHNLPATYNDFTIDSMYYCLLKFFGVDLELYNDDYSEDEIVSYNFFIQKINKVKNRVPIELKTFNYDYFVSKLICNLGLEYLRLIQV